MKLTWILKGVCMSTCSTFLGKKVHLNHIRKKVVCINMLHKTSTWSYCPSKYVRPKNKITKVNVSLVKVHLTVQNK